MRQVALDMRLWVRDEIAALRAGQRVAAGFAHPAEGESYPLFSPVPAGN